MVFARTADDRAVIAEERAVATDGSPFLVFALALAFSPRQQKILLYNLKFQRSTMILPMKSTNTLTYYKPKSNTEDRVRSQTKTVFAGVMKTEKGQVTKKYSPLKASCTLSLFAVSSEVTIERMNKMKAPHVTRYL